MDVYKSIVPTPAGDMIALAVSDGLVAFVNSRRKDLNRVLSRICIGKSVIHGDNEHITQLRSEIGEYFSKKRKKFDVKFILSGTPFQERAWRALCDIPFGTTITYREQAFVVGSPNGFRAVGRANGRNVLEIVVPCHRVVTKGGSLGGFASGVDIKQLLLEHEK